MEKVNVLLNMTLVFGDHHLHSDYSNDTCFPRLYVSGPAER